MKKFVSISILVCFFITGQMGEYPVYAQIDPVPFMPAPGVMVPLSHEYTPAYLKGIVIHPENALKFDFIIYKGDKPLSDSQKREEYAKLTKYFLASLAIPDDDQWVNLSPYEKDRIIKDDFGKTEMGRDLLAQDYMLKQITASLIYPEDNLGKEFWNKVYAQAQKQYGTTNIPVNTFNKVWILPDDALIYEKGNTAYVLKNHLRVMLEEDYLSLQKHTGMSKLPLSYKEGDGGSSNNTHSIASNIVRQIVLPELQREINEGKNFAALRQVYSGMLLATWFKRALKQSLLSQIYADKGKVRGVDQDPKTNEEIYQQYLKAYKKGVFNFIKDDVDKYTNETIPRKYFSGGTCDYAMANRILGSNILRRTGDHALIARVRAGLSRVDLVSVAMRLMSPVLPARKSSKADVESFRGLEALSSSIIQDSILWAFPTDGNYVQTVKALTVNHQRPSPPETLHIGVSGMQNLDIIAARRSHWGIVIDTSKKVKELYAFIEQTFADDPRIDRRSFKEKLMRKALAGTGALQMSGIMHQIDFEHKVNALKDVLWFENQRSFEFIKKMFLERRFICIPGDLVDENLFGRIKEWMGQEHVVLDTFYVSNVAQWLRRDNEMHRRDVPWGQWGLLQSRFEANIKFIADDETLILDAYQQKAGLYNQLGIYHKGDYAQISESKSDAAMTLVKVHSPQETLAAVQARIREGIPDGRAPTVITVDSQGNPLYRLGPGRVALDIDYRADRQRQLFQALEPGFSQFDVPAQWREATLLGTTQYIPEMDDQRYVVATDYYENSLPEVYARAGRPFVIALSEEKYQFAPKIRGNHSGAFATEDTSVIQIPMPKDASGKKIKNEDYWLYPKLDMLRTAKAFAAKIREYAKQGGGGFINLDALDLGTHVAAPRLNSKGTLNIERPDGTFYQVEGNGFDSARYYVQGMSEALQIIFEALQEVGGAAVFVSDHGSADDMRNPGHTGNDVPLGVIDFENRHIGKIGEPVQGGKINDLVRNNAYQRDAAPTHLQLAEIEKPAEMTGESVLPEGYQTKKNKFVATILTDGLGIGIKDDPMDAIQDAMKRGMAPTLKWLWDNFQTIPVPASGYIAGLRGGKEKDYNPKDLLTKKTVLERLRAKTGTNEVALTEIYYDFSSDPAREVRDSKVLKREDALKELETSPYLYDRWFVLNETEHGVEVVYFDKVQIGSTEFNTAVIADGRLVPQDVSRVDESLRTGEFFKTPAFQKAVAGFKRQGYAHLFGIMQESVYGVHASMTQLYHEIEFLKDQGIKTFMFDLAIDGRDEGDYESEDRIKQLESALAYFGIKDYYINLYTRDLMDRSAKWGMTQDLLDLLFLGHPRTIDAAMAGVVAGEAEKREEELDLYRRFLAELVLKHQLDLPGSDAKAVLPVARRSINDLQWHLFMDNGSYVDVFVRKNAIVAYGIVNLGKNHEVSLGFHNLEKGSEKGDYWASVYRERVKLLKETLAHRGHDFNLVLVAIDQIASPVQIGMRVSQVIENEQQSENYEQRLIGKIQMGMPLTGQDNKIIEINSFNRYYPFGPAAHFYVQKLGFAMSPLLSFDPEKSRLTARENSLMGRLMSGGHLTDLEVVELFSGRYLEKSAADIIKDVESKDGIEVNPAMTSPVQAEFIVHGNKIAQIKNANGEIIFQTDATGDNVIVQPQGLADGPVNAKVYKDTQGNLVELISNFDAHLTVVMISSDKRMHTLSYDDQWKKMADYGDFKGMPMHFMAMLRPLWPHLDKGIKELIVTAFPSYDAAGEAEESPRFVTSSGRFTGLDEEISQLPLPVNAKVHDTAASSGITSLELAQKLEGHVQEVTFSDRSFTWKVIRQGRLFGVFDDENRPLSIFLNGLAVTGQSFSDYTRRLLEEGEGVAFDRTDVRVEDYMSRHKEYMVQRQVDLRHELPVQKFDLVRSMNFIQYLDPADRVGLIERLGRSVKDGGWLIVGMQLKKQTLGYMIWQRRGNKLYPFKYSKPALVKGAEVDYMPTGEIDLAMSTYPAMINTPTGGIDLNAANLAMIIKRDGKGVPLPLSQQDLAQLSNIEGLDPVILSIKPASQTGLFSELAAHP